MPDYQGFTVQLSLSDGSKVKGTISEVDGKKIVLQKVTYINTDQNVKDLTVESGKIKDLVVLELPKSKQDPPQRKKKPLKKQKEVLPGSAITTDLESSVVQTTPVQRSRKSHSPKSAHSQVRSQKSGKRRDEEVNWDDSNDLPEFDFQENLAKFDKSSVFAELSLNDSIDPSQRLVGHNKTSNVVPPPKANYDIHEMVKEGSNWDQNWDSIKTSDQEAIAKLTLKLHNDAMQQQQQQQQQIPSRLSTSTPTSSLAYSVVKDGTTEKLPLCSPINLLEIERISQDEFGYNSSLILENAGRGLSSVILQILGAQSSRLNSSNAKFNVNSPPLVLLLVGNNRTGAKALSAGRHLSNRGVRIISLLISDNDGDDELMSMIATQLELFENFGGKTVYNLNQLKQILRQVDSPLELIIDGLQGFDTNLSDLMEIEFTKAIQVIDWANKQQCYKLSIDISSGIDSGSGQLNELNSIYIESKFIISTGLPLTALLYAYTNGLISDNIHYLVDIGVPKKVFQRGSLRKFDRSWFGTEWFVKLNVSK